MSQEVARRARRIDELFGFSPELQEQGIVIYLELLVKPWRIVYRAENRSVYILAIIDSRRDAVDLLWERLTR